MYNRITLVLFSLFLITNLGISQIELPFDFETTPTTSDFIDFDGGTATVIANPQSSGINTSSSVAQIVRDGGQPWSGSKIRLTDFLDFTVNNTFTMKVFSPATGTPVLFKLEGPGAATPDNVVSTTVANEWETLTWNFPGLASNTYDEVVFIFDFGTVGDGSASSTFLFDDVEFIDNSGGLDQMSLPVTFDDTSVFYELIDFEGAGPSAVVVDPTDPNNTVATVLKSTSSGTSGGTTMGGIGFPNPIPFTAENTTMSVRVWSPDAGIPVRLKVENSNDVTVSVETEATTMVAMEWDTLTFDFSNEATGTAILNLASTYNKASIFFNFGQSGAAAGDKTYYWDDVEFGGEVTPPGDPITFPVDFQSETIDYIFENFDGGDLSLIDNPDPSGINTSTKVAKMVKSPGQPWGGSFMTLSAPIDFSMSTMITMNVWAPSVGSKVLLKLENSADGAVFVEVEEATTTANAWEELSFDFSAIDPASSYDRVVLIFELGTMGDGSDAFTYYVDNLQLDEGAGVELINAADAGIRISPNPAQSFIRIDLKDALKSSANFMLFDISGRLLIEENSTTQTTTINVVDLQNGMYFLKINIEDKSYFQKVFIAK